MSKVIQEGKVMITTIILGISGLPVLLIMYFVLKGMGKERNHSLFGITLWQDAMKEEGVQEVIRTYKKQLKYWTVFFLVAQIVMYPIKYISIVIMLWLIWLFAMIICMYIPYVKANKKMRLYKAQYQTKNNETPQNSMYVDVTSIMEKKPKYFGKATWIACIVGFLPAIVAVILDKKVSSSATPELWVVEVTLLSMSLVGVICVWLVSYYSRQPVTVLTTDSEVNRQFTRIKSYQCSKMFCTLAWMTAVFNVVMVGLFYWNIDSGIMVKLVIGICVLYGIIPLIAVGMGWHIIQKQKRKLLEGKEVLLTEDDENWIWGIFYYNKNDNRFWVNNKLGTGTTINMAKPGAVVFNVIVIGLTVVISIGAVVLCALDEFVPVKLEYKNGELNASQWKQEYQIEEEDISSVTLLETLPSMSRSGGTSLDNLYKGKWFSRELDRRFKVCLNPEENPFLMIETKDGTWYLLGDESGEQTKEIYEKLNK